MPDSALDRDGSADVSFRRAGGILPVAKRVAAQRDKSWLSRFADRIVDVVRFPNPPVAERDDSFRVAERGD